MDVKLAKAAKSLNISSAEMKNRLINEEFIEEDSTGRLKIKPKGLNEGVFLRKGKFGLYIVVSEEFLNNFGKLV